MNKSKLLSAALVVAIATTTASCHIYKKFEMPEEGIAGEVAAAQKEAVDSTALGNVKWEQVFTDPQLQALIQIALDSNVDLENARLNVDIAKAQLQGAKLSYLPSVALTPNGGTASYGGSKITKDSWSYTIPATASWEIDVFGKLLNNKRNAEAAVLQTEAYRQAVRSQIISGVANCYYTIAMLQRQLQILNETSAIWQESIKTMQDLIAEQFAIDADEISMDSSFVDDLGADSVDLVELVMAMEEEFNVGEIDEDDLTGLKTVGDCVRYLYNKMS